MGNLMLCVLHAIVGMGSAVLCLVMLAALASTASALPTPEEAVDSEAKATTPGE